MRVPVLVMVCTAYGFGGVASFGQGASSGRLEGSETLRAFADHVESAGDYPAEARRFVMKQLEQRSPDKDTADVLLESLAVLSAEFRAGLDAYDAGDYDAAYRRMHALSGVGDPYLSANAAVFAVKALVDADRLEEAQEELDALLAERGDLDLYTFFAAETAFLRGYVQLLTLEYEGAIDSLNAFLRDHPEASQRMTISARQMLAELQRREPERIGDVADLMVYAGRRLEHADTGERVQQRQQRAIDLLDRLIQEAEQQEQSGGGGGGGGGGSGQAPQSPMPDSQLPGGSRQSEQLRNARRASPGESWGSMPPAERAEILQMLRDSFPSRYRHLVEQYFQELSKQP